jgi:O-antigen/teichoic acid export membrane protein/LmbE family N-acetylglucosaminyl deacetylase
MTASPVSTSPVPARRTRSQTLELQAGSRWITGAATLIGILNYGYALVLTHILSSRGYANFAAAQALLLTAGTIAGSAVPWVLAYQITRPGADRRARRAAVAFAWTANAVAGLCAAAIVVAIASRLLPWTGLTAVAAGTVLIFLATTPGGWLLGRRSFATLAALRLAEVVLKIVAGLGLAFVHGGPTGPLTGFAVGSAAILLLGSYLMRGDMSVGRSGARFAGSLRMTFGMTAVQGLVAALASVDVVAVALLPLSASTAGNYQAAVVLARVPLFIAGGIAAVIFPLLADAHSRVRLTETALLMYAAVAVPLLAAVVTVPPAIVGLVLPARYGQVSDLLPILGPSGVAIGLVALDATLLQSTQHYRRALTRQVPGLLFTVTAVIIGGVLAGTRGLATGALLGTAGTAIMLRRSGTGEDGRRARLPRWSAPTLVALTGLLLVLHPYPALWLMVAVATVLFGVHIALVRTPGQDTMTVRPRHRRPRRLAGSAHGGVDAQPDGRPDDRNDAQPEDRPPAAAATAGRALSVNRSAAYQEMFRVHRRVVEGAEVFELVEPPDLRYLVISPHLDDAILSCGALLNRLSPGHLVTVATLFTHSSPHATLSARAFVRKCGYGRAEDLYRDRRAEDVSTLDMIGVESVHLGFVDALFRVKPAVADSSAPFARLLPGRLVIYPSYRRHIASGRVSPFDAATLAEVTAALDEIVRERADVIIAPAGIGGHVDHVLARDVAERCTSRPVVFYADLPYARDSRPDTAFLQRRALVPVVLTGGQREKRALVGGYETQVRALFHNKVPDLPETYFVPADRIEIV